MLNCVLLCVLIELKNALQLCNSASKCKTVEFQHQQVSWKNFFFFFLKEPLNFLCAITESRSDLYVNVSP